MAKLPSPTVNIDAPSVPFKDPAVGVAFSSLASQLSRVFGRFTQTNSPSSRLLVSSPDGSVFSVTVDDSGNISATKVAS